MPFNFQRKIIEFRLLQRNLPAVIGNMAKRHFVQSFRDGGFTDAALDPWEQRKRNPQTARAILVKTGHLRNSIRVRVATFDKIEIGSYGVPYAEFHNTGAGKLPKRQFIGKSKVLEKKIKARIQSEMKKILK